MGISHCKISRGKIGELEQVPDSILSHNQKMSSGEAAEAGRLFLGERSVEQREVNTCCGNGIWERLMSGASFGQ